MTVTSVSRRLRRLSPDWLIAAVLLITVLALWLPFGLNIGPSGDGWFFYMNARYGAAWAAPDRPLVALAYLLGYALAPGQFAGFNLMLVILLFARSGLCYGILRQLGSGRALAFAAALLTALMPADTGVFYTGALNVYWAWVAYLLALFLLIRYWQKPRLIVLALLWCAQIVNLGTYEAAYPLLLVSPLVLLLLPPRRSRGTWIRMLARWYLFPVLNGFRLAALLLLNPSNLHYQSGLIQQGTTIGAMLASLVTIYERHFFTGWLVNPVSLSNGLIALAVGVLAFAVCAWLARRDAPLSRRLYSGFALAGLAIIGLGVAVLLPTSLSDVTTRTYFASSVGAALALAAVFWLLTRRALPFALLVGIMAALGCGQLLQQHAGEVETTQAQQAIFGRVAARVPALAPNSTLLIMDETPERELTSIFGLAWHFQTVFLVLYDDPTLAAAICYPDDTPDNTSNYCAFRADDVEVRISPLITWTRPYKDVVLVRYSASHEFVVSPDLAPYARSAAYDPDALVKRLAAPSAGE